MRATPSFRRFARTIARPPSSWVMGAGFSRAPSAMPTRSAPSSQALALISAAVSGFRYISTQFLLLSFELLQLLRHHPLVAFRSHPARVPLRQAGARLAFLARLLPLLLQLSFLRSALGDHLLRFRQVRVIVVADGA